MNAPASRRGFLRGLTTLPLIGGGVTLLGRPTAVAAPCTDALLGRYHAWLALEHQAVAREYVRRDAEAERAKELAAGRFMPPRYVERIVEHHGREARWWAPDDAAAAASVASAPASSRAALVLSAVGCELAA